MDKLRNSTYETYAAFACERSRAASDFIKSYVVLELFEANPGQL